MSAPESERTRARPLAIAVAWVTVAGAMLVFDLVWLGIVARGHYDEALGPLRATEVYWPAALGFYAMYVSFVVGFAVLPTDSVKQSGLRGAGMGLFAYATYELTNWAVISDWPGSLVIPDVLWGVVLTGGIAMAGALASHRLR